MQAIRNAIFNVVHDFGTDEAAALLGKSRGTVAHEARPPEGSPAKMGVIDSTKIQLAAHDFRILQAQAEVCGFVLVQMPQPAGDDAATNEVLMRVAALAKEFGESMATISAALSDNRITQNELMQFDKESMELMQALSAVRAVMHAKAERDKVQPIRGVV